MKAKVLVTDGEQRAALAVVRSLGRAGYEVHVCSARARSIAGASRYCAASHQVADPLEQPARFLSDLVRLTKTTSAQVLLPVTEAALLVVLPRRDNFECVIPFPSAEAFDSICDKRAVLGVAATHGIAVPPQNVVTSPVAVAGIEKTLKFPVVVKPSRSVAGKEGERVRSGVAYVDDSAALASALSHIPVNAYPVLLQQRILGPGSGVSVLVWDGELVAAFAHRRIREKPPSGGVSVLRESIPLDHDILSRSLALLRDFSWRGVAMVEYKLDEATSVPYLMEINGRLWGSLQLAIDAGVDFPRLLVELALGHKPSRVVDYRIGVRSRWEWGDVDNLLATVLHPAKFAVILPSRRFPRLAALTQFIRGFGGDNLPEIFQRDDPAPILRETLDWFRRR